MKSRLLLEIQDRKEQKVYLETPDPKVCQDVQVIQDLSVRREKKEL